MANSKEIDLSEYGLPYQVFVMIVRIGAWATLGILATAVLVFVAMCVKYGAGGPTSSRAVPPLDLEYGSDDILPHQSDGYQDCPPAYEEANVQLELPPSYAETEAAKPAIDGDCSSLAADRA